MVSKLNFSSDSSKAPWQEEISAMPSWLRPSLGKASDISTVQRIIKTRQIHTICEEGRCPNRGEMLQSKNGNLFADGPYLHPRLWFLSSG